MSLGLLGKKLGMTRLFDHQAGIMIPVTVIDDASSDGFTSQRIRELAKLVHDGKTLNLDQLPPVFNLKKARKSVVLMLPKPD